MEEALDWGLDKRQSKEELDKLRALVDECWEESQEIKRAEDELERRRAEVSSKEKTVKEVLEASGLTMFAGTSCVYSLKEEQGIKGPETESDWAEFKAWMLAKYPEAYESFFKMHLGSLKAFVKKEIALEQERGVECPSIPGIPAPEPFVLLKSKVKK